MLPSPTFPLHSGFGRVSLYVAGSAAAGTHFIVNPISVLSISVVVLIRLSGGRVLPSPTDPLHFWVWWGKPGLTRFGCLRNHIRVLLYSIPGPAGKLVGAGRACCNSLVWVLFGRSGHLSIEVFVRAESWPTIGRAPHSGLVFQACPSPLPLGPGWRAL